MKIPLAGNNKVMLFIDDADNRLYASYDRGKTFTALGTKGDKGDTGTAATVQVGTVQTGAAGSQAQVTNAGSNSAAVLNFVIPKGDKGDTGDDGKTPTFSVNENGELIATFE